MTQSIDINNLYQQEQFSNSKKKQIGQDKAAAKNKLTQTADKELDYVKVNHPINWYEEGDFRTVCRRILGDKYHAIRITNETNTSKDTDRLYLFEISFDLFTIMIVKGKKKTIMQFDCTSDTLTINNEKQSDDNIDLFVKEINKVGNDMKQNKTSCIGLFEEKK